MNVVSYKITKTMAAIRDWTVAASVVATWLILTQPIFAAYQK